ncbi:MAG: alpha/beta hydrolase domain-containing protein, partial [Candidatus Binatia bacterium]
MITRVAAERREIFAGGYEFPVTGAYEKIAGRAFGEVHPKSPLNRVIVNLDRAPRNQRGNVEYWTDFFILKPMDMRRGNGKLIYDAPNRGTKKILMFLNDAPESNDPSTREDGGNGFLMREGYTIVWSGWQGDLIEKDQLLCAGVPVATDRGRTISGTARTEIVVNSDRVYSCPLTGNDWTVSYEPAVRERFQASLTVREKSYGPRIPVRPSDWDFATCSQDAASRRMEVRPSTTDLYIRSGFKPGWVYELIYRAKNPLVLGLGFAAVRDLIAFLRHQTRDRAGSPHPLRRAEEENSIKKAYGWGRSQSGRFLRDFVYHGFNEDEAHRRVFEAIAPHAAGGGRVFLNYEFARPDTSAQQHSDQLDPEVFPFAYNVIKDPQTGRRDGILKRPKTDPYVLHTNTSTEYWQKRAALAHTDGKGKDLSLPERVRMYLIASAQHNTPFGSAPKRAKTQQLTNPVTVGDALRALIVALDRWVSEGVSPPPSRIPTARDGTLVKPGQNSTRFPKIPGVRYSGLHNRQLFLDYGRDSRRGRIDVHPPKASERGSYVILVPKVDADGNDIAGIRLPAIRVPLGTYTGWNLQVGSLAENELAGLLGSFIPFALTARKRKQTGDPRPSIQERYPDYAEYKRRICIEVRRMIEERFLLPEDGERIIRDAASRRWPYAAAAGAPED